MLRGILAHLTLGVATAVCALPVMVLAPLLPRKANLTMRMARIWSRVMLMAVGARVHYNDPADALKRTRCIFIANHQSNVDIWALASVLPLSTRFVAKQELFRIPLLGGAMAAAGFISINRSNRSEAIRSLAQAADEIRAGSPVILFPEGTRSADGSLQPFKKGAFHLANQAGVPIVPVAISGTYEIWPRGSFRVRSGQVSVHLESAIEVPSNPRPRTEDLMRTVRSAIENRLYPGRPCSTGAAESS